MKVFDLLFGSQHSFLERSAFTTIEVGLRYFLFAGFAWMLGYWLFRNRWFHRKIIARFPVSADVRREIGYSLLTLVIFGVMAGAGLRAQDKPKEAPPSKPTAGEAAKDGAKKEEAKDSKDEKKSVTEHAIPWGRVTAAPRSRRMRRISMACARMPVAWASSSGST